MIKNKDKLTDLERFTCTKEEVEEHFERMMRKSIAYDYSYTKALIDELKQRGVLP